MDEVVSSAERDAAQDAAVLPPGERARLLGSAGLLLLLALMAAPYGGLLSIPLLFFLKNRLHLSAHALAVFNLWTSLPLYAAFLFGLLRDRWSPFGAGDRGHLMLFGGLTAAGYVALAFTAPTYATLLVGLTLATALIQTVLGATNGLFSALGQKHLMPGQASAVLNIAVMLPLLAGFALGGVFSQALEGLDAVGAARSVFLLGAALVGVVAVAGAIAPRSLFPPRPHAPQTNFLGDLARLALCRPVYAPVLLLLLWNFAPSFGAALQYHLSNTLHATDAQVGGFYAIFWGVYIPSFLAYGWLCQRVRLSRLLLWSTLLAIPQMLPLLIVHTAEGALLAAIPMSLMGGLASAAYLDLAIRSCPKGLQGTMMMLVSASAYFIALRLGDLLGTEIYDRHGGFVMTVVASTAVYALMLPVLLLAPRALTATRDGETLAGVS
ncbi:MAG: MFS transporter [Phenylobacterium sp.]